MKILLTGASGQLGTDLAALIEGYGHHELVAAGHDRLDIGDRDAVLTAVTSLRPDLVVNAGAWTAVDACEADPDRAWRANGLGPRHLAEGCRLTGAHLVQLSTDYVFDGTSPRPYVEWDPPRPQSVYGQSKRAGEIEVLTQLPGATVVRTSWVCGPNGSNMVKTVLRLAASPGILRFVDDQRGCPTFTPDLAGMVYRLGIGRRPGIFHVTNQGPTSWYGFARDVLAAAGHDPERVEPVSTAELVARYPAPRPANSVLDNAALRASGIPLLDDYHEPLRRTVRQLVA
ncbi:MAG TPA: dTDP-4-dehydrorhamnose reductase [Acidimicrobiales bacterium]|nr:dTDP-4-dehydrorhamnose reductase [Acidimicrobiales bacterium]